MSNFIRISDPNLEYTNTDGKILTAAGLGNFGPAAAEFGENAWKFFTRSKPKPPTEAPDVFNVWKNTENVNPKLQNILKNYNSGNINYTNLFAQLNKFGIDSKNWAKPQFQIEIANGDGTYTTKSKSILDILRDLHDNPSLFNPPHDPTIIQQEGGYKPSSRNIEDIQTFLQNESSNATRKNPQNASAITNLFSGIKKTLLIFAAGGLGLAGVVGWNAYHATSPSIPANLSQDSTGGSSNDVDSINTNNTQSPSNAYLNNSDVRYNNIPTPPPVPGLSSNEMNPVTLQPYNPNTDYYVDDLGNIRTKGSNNTNKFIRLAAGAAPSILNFSTNQNQNTVKSPSPDNNAINSNPIDNSTKGIPEVPSVSTFLPQIIALLTPILNKNGHNYNDPIVYKTLIQFLNSQNGIISNMSQFINSLGNGN